MSLSHGQAHTTSNAHVHFAMDNGHADSVDSSDDHGLSLDDVAKPAPQHECTGREGHVNLNAFKDRRSSSARRHSVSKTGPTPSTSTTATDSCCKCAAHIH